MFLDEALTDMTWSPAWTLDTNHSRRRWDQRENTDHSVQPSAAWGSLPRPSLLIHSRTWLTTPKGIHLTGCLQRPGPV